MTTPIDPKYTVAARFAASGRNSNDVIPTPEYPEAMRFAYSNRAPGQFKDGKFIPDFVGGAARVVFDSGIDAWIAQGRQVSKAEYEAMDDDEKFPLTPFREYPFTDRKPLRLYLFPVIKEDAKQHYSFANAVLWPIHHLMDPYYFTHPLKAMMKIVEEGQRHIFHYNKPQLESAYQEYQHFNNEYANRYIKRLLDYDVIKPERGDKIDVHDYQCADVIGDTFLFHIPIPSIEYLESLQVRDPSKRGAYENMLQPGGVFNRYLDTILDNHSSINCQRTGDQYKLMKLIQHFHPEIQQPEFNEAPWTDFTIPARGVEGAIDFTWPDKKHKGGWKHIRLMNIPVGTSQEHNLKEARDFEHLFRTDISPTDQQSLDYTPREYSRKTLASTGIALPKGTKSATVAEILGDTLKTFEDLKNENIRKPKHLRKSDEELQNDVCGFMVNGGRNDPSKYFLAQIEAAKILYTKRPDAKKKMKFVLFAQPTRPEVDAYKKYDREVVKAAKQARQEFGDAFIVINDKYEHGEMMALLRHPNMKAKIDSAPWDGHALTAREPADARADWTQAQLEANPPAILMSTGIGASDVLRGPDNGDPQDKERGAILFNPHQDMRMYINSMATAMIRAYDMQYDKERYPNGRKELAARYRVMADESAKYTGKFYGETVANARSIIGPRELSNNVSREKPDYIIVSPGERVPEGTVLPHPSKTPENLMGK